MKSVDYFNSLRGQGTGRTGWLEGFAVPTLVVELAETQRRYPTRGVYPELVKRLGDETQYPFGA